MYNKNKEKDIKSLFTEPFIIQFSDSARFTVNDIITRQINSTELKVVKVYNKVWWRKFLLFFGFKTKLFDCIKVVPIQDK